MYKIDNNRKRAMIVIALFSFLIYDGNAQETTFGLKGGLNYSSVVGDLTDGIKFRFSGHVGLFLEIAFTEKFQLQPELLYSSQGFQFSTDLAAIQNGVLLAKKMILEPTCN
ncbi:hypothetical protein BFP77_09170 [Maribacter sp. 4U21]|uniref:outer membrane beta-barrel protein n=1 Tax=Maribacter sp. 4U21 TaxID=1889779 RepID=UPI000C14CB61|nr:outer membrane beta-barrel protein [Maribacter sp. 4U21]PIB28791.1 hypothetical protein BFP77_09170 [Maribacter sp. 4U21]